MADQEGPSLCQGHSLFYKSIANTSSGLSWTLVSVKGAPKIKFIHMHTILLNDTELFKETICVKELQNKLSSDGQKSTPQMPYKSLAFAEPKRRKKNPTADESCLSFFYTQNNSRDCTVELARTQLPTAGPSSLAPAARFVHSKWTSSKLWDSFRGLCC